MLLRRSALQNLSGIDSGDDMIARAFAVNMRRDEDRGRTVAEQAEGPPAAALPSAATMANLRE